MTPEEKIELNFRRTRAAIEARKKKYTEAELREFSSKGGKNSPSKWTKGDPRAKEASIKGVEARKKNGGKKTNSK